MNEMQSWSWLGCILSFPLSPLHVIAWIWFVHLVLGPIQFLATGYIEMQSCILELLFMRAVTHYAFQFTFNLSRLVQCSDVILWSQSSLQCKCYSVAEQLTLYESAGFLDINCQAVLLKWTVWACTRIFWSKLRLHASRAGLWLDITSCALSDYALSVNSSMVD